MSEPAQAPRWHLPWCWLVDSPLVIATWVSLVMGLLALVQVASTLREADRVRTRSGQVLAQVAAEAAAAQLANVRPAAAPGIVQVGRVPVAVDARGDEWLLTAMPPEDRSWQFRCQRLPGAAPRALARAFTGSAGAAPFLPPGFAVATEAWPELDPEALAEGWSAQQVPAFSRDVGIGLLHFVAGTELDDFVVDPNRPRLGLSRDADLVVVPGHLWIESGESTWRLWLDRDLTIVVLGNLYVGRSIEVAGSGRLVFATAPTPGARAFADCDGDGRWSAGDVVCDGLPFAGAIEGGGSVYVGPGRGDVVASIGAGLVVGGQLHLRGSCRVDGPVVLAHGITPLGDTPARLTPTGAHRFVADRELVPGFRTTGPARPGLLRPVDANRGAGEEPLYLARPGR